MNASEIARHLHGRRNGTHGWLVCCPAHEDRTPSLSIKDSETGRLIVKCFGGCDGRDVIAAFRTMGYLGPLDAVRPYVPAPSSVVRDCNLGRIARASAIWTNTQPARGSAVETYLRARGYDAEIPGSLRYHPALRHPYLPGTFPCMVAAVTIAPDRDVVAIHRTYLRSDGSGKADIEQPKAMLGDVRGGSVRLAPSAKTLVIAEGIETGLSVMQQRGLPVWAAMSAAGVETLVLGPLTHHVIIAADRDKMTSQHPRGHGYAAAEKAAARWRQEGRTVEIVLPPDGIKDFNDLVLRKQVVAAAFP